MDDLKYQIELAIESDNYQLLEEILDECKGSYAVKYVLEALLKKGERDDIARFQSRLLALIVYL